MKNFVLAIMALFIVCFLAQPLFAQRVSISAPFVQVNQGRAFNNGGGFAVRRANNQALQLQAQANFVNAQARLLNAQNLTFNNAQNLALAQNLAFANTVHFNQNLAGLRAAQQFQQLQALNFANQPAFLTAAPQLITVPSYAPPVQQLQFQRIVSPVCH